MNKNAEIIVVGGGSAGCAMASRLAQSGLKVLLLEAGKPDKNIKIKIPALMASIVQNPDFDWKFQNNPDSSMFDRADVWPAGKTLGGGSSINGMLYLRGHRWDYDNWVKMGATGWSYDELAPYFKRMETFEGEENNYRGSNGPIGVSKGRVDLPVIDDWIKAVESYGIKRTSDHNGENPGEGVDYAQTTQKRGLRSSSTNHLNMPGVAENLTVETEVFVRRLIIEDGRAIGVEYEQNGTQGEVRAAQGVVLSAGSMTTPRLLMHSGIGPADHLKEIGIDVKVDLQGVGANLQEHVGVHLVSDVTCSTINTESRGLSAIKNGLNFMLFRRGILTTSIGHAQAYLSTRENLPAPNIQMILGAMAFDFDDEGKMMLRKGSAINSMLCLSRPQSRGKLTLRSDNPHDNPVIDHQLLSNDDDLAQIAEAVEIAREIHGQIALKQHITGEVRPGKDLHGDGLKEFIRRAGIPLYHPCGTCRMGDGADAVVDADLKVQGVEGLWVADASIIPSMPSGNINGTSLMIGDKGSDHVLKTL